MLLQILTILQIVLMYVDGTASDHDPKHAVSTQSFHRDDVPLSYKYTAVHIYTTPHPEPKQNEQQTNYGSSKYKYIQYAPLEQKKYETDKHRYTQIPEQAYGQGENVSQQLKQATEENRYNHLEPRVFAESLDVHDQSIRSYVPGHNIEVLPSPRVLGKNDLYRAYHNHLRNQNFNAPKFVIQRQPEKHVHHTLENFRAAEQRPLSEEHSILYTFMPRPILTTQHNAYEVGKPYILHQALPAKNQRLHLNIARVYGIANIPHQAQASQINRPDKANLQSHTEAIFHPLQPPTQQKTILYPVQDKNKNYPIHT